MQFLTILLLILNLPAQSDDKCRQMLKDAYQAIVSFEATSGNKPIRMRIETNVQFKSPYSTEVEQEQATMNIYSNGSLTYYSLKDMEVWSDKKFTVTVTKKHKKVYITHTDRNQENLPEKVLQFRKTLLNEAIITNCSQEEKGQDAFTVVSLRVPAGKGGETASVTDMKFRLRASDKRITSLTLFFKPGSPVNQLDYSFSKIETDDGRFLKKEPLKNVLDNKNRLLPHYSGYQIVDATGLISK